MQIFGWNNRTDKHRATAANNMCRKLGEICRRGFWDMRTDRQTNRHTDMLIAIIRTHAADEAIKQVRRNTLRQRNACSNRPTVELCLHCMCVDRPHRCWCLRGAPARRPCACVSRRAAHYLAETFLDVHGRPHSSSRRHHNLCGLLHLLVLLQEGRRQRQTAAGNSAPSDSQS